MSSSCAHSLLNSWMDPWLVVSMDRRVRALLSCVLLHTLLTDGFRHLDDLFLNLRAGNVDDLLSHVIGNSSLWNKLGHLPSFLSNPWNWHGNDLLHRVVLHLVVWNVLHNFNLFHRHWWNMDVRDFFNDALLNSFLRHRRNHVLILVLRLVKALVTISSIIEKSTLSPLNSKEINFGLDAELLCVLEDRPSSPLARLPLGAVP